MKKTIAILQSNYIPWKGYFDIIRSVDEFVLYDSVQFTKNDWRNRNRIKTAQGVIWLTIPVRQSLSLLINEVEVADNRWRRKHWNAISQNYSKAPYFKQYRDRFEELYLGCDETNLSRINHTFIYAICEILGIRTKISRSTEYELKGNPTERLVNICLQAKGQYYLSGPSGKNYLNTVLFESMGIDVEWMEYAGYKEYPQFHPPFEHSVSIIDLIFHAGDNALAYMNKHPW